MSLVHLKNKKTKTIYVYECKSFWNKEKKKPDSKRLCIGKLDPITNKIIPTRKARQAETQRQLIEQSALVRSIGAFMLLDNISKKLGIEAILEKIFPEHCNLILSLAYFQAMEKKALSKAEHWSVMNRHPYNNFIDNRRISDLLPTINEEKQLAFFKEWTEKRLKEEYLAYDITSISSYSDLNNMVRYGYNRDDENLPQINLGMLFGETSLLPVYFRSLPGSIRDVSTLRNFLETASFLDMKNLHLVMDKGFYSKKNVEDLLKNNMKFTIAVPFSCEFAKDHVERVRDYITDHKYFIKINGQNIFCVSYPIKFEQNKDFYVHVYYNAYSAVSEYESFLNKLHQWENELKSKPLEKNKNHYKTYFFVKKTSKKVTRITYNQKAIDTYKKNTAGYLVLLSNDIKDPSAALQVYRNKDVVEKTFDNLKNSIDSKRLRVHLDESMKGRLFIQFISLILISYIQKTAKEKDIFKFIHSTSSLLDELKLYNAVTISGGNKHIYSEITKDQRKIFEAFDIVL